MEGKIVYVGETYIEGGAEVELENGLRIEVFPDAFGEPVYFAWDRNRADAPVEMELEEVNRIVREALKITDDEFARKWLEKWLEVFGEDGEEVKEMEKIYVHKESDFFEGGDAIYTSVPIECAVALDELLTEAGRGVFGEESYQDLLEDLYLSYDNPEEAWPEGLLLPRYPPKDEWAKEIYEKRRAQVLEYARLVREYIKKGYRPVRAVMTEDKELTPYQHPNPHAGWASGRRVGEEFVILARFEDNEEVRVQEIYPDGVIGGVIITLDDGSWIRLYDPDDYEGDLLYEGEDEEGYEWYPTIEELKDIIQDALRLAETHDPEEPVEPAMLGWKWGDIRALLQKIKKILSPKAGPAQAGR